MKRCIVIICLLFVLVFVISGCKNADNIAIETIIITEYVDSDSGFKFQSEYITDEEKIKEILVELELIDLSQLSDDQGLRVGGGLVVRLVDDSDETYTYVLYNKLVSKNGTFYDTEIDYEARMRNIAKTVSDSN